MYRGDRGKNNIPEMEEEINFEFSVGGDDKKTPAAGFLKNGNRKEREYVSFIIFSLIIR